MSRGFGFISSLSKSVKLLQPWSVDLTNFTNLIFGGFLPFGTTVGWREPSAIATNLVLLHHKPIKSWKSRPNIMFIKKLETICLLWFSSFWSLLLALSLKVKTLWEGHKIWKITHLFWKINCFYSVVSKHVWYFFQIFAAFLEKLNFMNEKSYRNKEMEIQV